MITVGFKLNFNDFKAITSRKMFFILDLYWDKIRPDIENDAYSVKF